MLFTKNERSSHPGTAEAREDVRFSRSTFLPHGSFFFSTSVGGASPTSFSCTASAEAEAPSAAGDGSPRWASICARSYSSRWTSQINMTGQRALVLNTMDSCGAMRSTRQHFSDDVASGKYVDGGRLSASRMGCRASCRSSLGMKRSSSAMLVRLRMKSRCVLKKAYSSVAAGAAASPVDSVPLSERRCGSYCCVRSATTRPTSGSGRGVSSTALAPSA